MRKVLAICLFLSGGFLFADIRQVKLPPKPITAMFSFQCLLYAGGVDNDPDPGVYDIGWDFKHISYGYGFSAGLSIYNTVRVFTDLILDTEKFLDGTTLGDFLPNAMIRVGLWNAMVSFRKMTFNLASPKFTKFGFSGKMYNIDFVFDCGDFNEDTWARTYFGFTYRYYEDFDWNGYGLTVYCNTIDAYLTNKRIEWGLVPYGKLGASLYTGPMTDKAFQKMRELDTDFAPEYSSADDWNNNTIWPISFDLNLVLGFGYIFNCYGKPLCLAIGYDLLVDSLMGVHQGVNINLSIKF